MCALKSMIGGYGFDAGAADYLGPIRREAQGRCLDFLQVPPLDQKTLREFMQCYGQCSAVLIVPSSMTPRAEIMLGRMLAADSIPFWIAEDVPYAAYREGAMILAGKARGLIAATEYSAREAARLGLYHEIRFCGLPQNWKEKYETMSRMREQRAEIRPKLMKDANGRTSPLDPEDFLLFIPGSRQFGMANQLIRFAFLMEKIVSRDRLVIAFKPHPGERAEALRIGKAADFERAILTQRRTLLSTLSVLEFNPEEFSIAHLYGLADVVLVSGARTDDIPAAMAHLRMVYWANERTRRYLAETGAFFVRGSGGKTRKELGKWYVPELGASLKVTTRTFAASVRSLLASQDTEQKLREAQERYFPVPEVWDTASAVINLVCG